MREIDEKLAKLLLVEIGVLTEVEKNEDGEVIATLSSEDIAQYDKLTVDRQEIQSLEKLVKEMQIKLRTKIIVHTAQRDLWWANMQLKHGITKDKLRGGMHVDHQNSILRAGILKISRSPL